MGTGPESMRPVAAIPLDQRRQSSLRTQNCRRAVPNHPVGQSVTLRTSDGSAPPAVGAFDGSGAEIGRLLDRQHDLPRRATRPWIAAPIASQMTNRIQVASEVAVARPGLVMVRDVKLGVLEREAAQRLLAFGSQSDAPCSTEVCRYPPLAAYSASPSRWPSSTRAQPRPACSRYSLGRRTSALPSCRGSSRSIAATTAPTRSAHSAGPASDPSSTPPAGT